MHQLTLEWTFAGKSYHRTLTVTAPQTNRFVLGRDPAGCDVVLAHPTVSGLHVEISFDEVAQQFVLHPLKPNNPPRLNGQAIADQAPLVAGSQLQLGQQAIAITQVAIAPIRRVGAPSLGQSLAATVLPPHLQPPPGLVAGLPAVMAASHAAMGLRCPHCRRVLPYEQLQAGCHWCGTSLAAADSVFLEA